MRNILKFLALGLFFIFCSCWGGLSDEDRILGELEMKNFKKIDLKEYKKLTAKRSPVKNAYKAVEVYVESQHMEDLGVNANTKSIRNAWGNNFILIRKKISASKPLIEMAYFMEYDNTFTGSIDVVDLRVSYRCESSDNISQWSSSPCDELLN